MFRVIDACNAAVVLNGHDALLEQTLSAPGRNQSLPFRDCDPSVAVYFTLDVVLPDFEVGVWGLSWWYTSPAFSWLRGGRVDLDRVRGER